MTENMDREDTMFEVEDTIDKIKFLLDDFMEQQMLLGKCVQYQL